MCAHVRKNPYFVSFKARDSGFPVSLVNFKTVAITVNAPAPENLTAESLGNGINLSWDASVCENAQGYLIYRRSDSSAWEPGYCETGVPSYTGFQLIGKVDGVNTVFYRDDNAPEGLVQGIKYCYRITAWFVDGAESYASNEACAHLKRDVPIITHVTNDSADLNAGHVSVDWAKPTELDTVQYPGPYRYIVYRNDGLNWTNPVKLTTLQGMGDTAYYDANVNLNNHNGPYSYRIDLESSTVGFIGSSQNASSIFLQIKPYNKRLKLFWQPKVPWVNNSFTVYRKNSVSGLFDSIGVTEEKFYMDDQLINNTEYCYFVKSKGSYSLTGLPNPLINYSQIACAVPNDYEPPCPPHDTVSTNCETLENRVQLWLSPIDSCYSDLDKYLIYFAHPGNQLQLIDSIQGNHADTVLYIHGGLDNIVGCYAAKAVDSVGNVSSLGNVYCVDWNACPQYALPNVFTPNGDQINDFLVPLHAQSSNPKANVDHIDLTIFNRWGRVVFQTNDPMIQWDGKNQKNKQDCPEGVYFYTCTVYVITGDGLQKQHLQGSVTIMR